MISQAAAVVTPTLTAIIAAGVLFQFATLARLGVGIAWELGLDSWKRR